MYENASGIGQSGNIGINGRFLFSQQCLGCSIEYVRLSDTCARERERNARFSLGGFRPVRELADKMNLIIHEYYDSGDADETIRCLKELNVPHFFHEFVYELMDFCLEKNTER